MNTNRDPQKIVGYPSYKPKIYIPKNNSSL